jgi:hypothetical protein
MTRDTARICRHWVAVLVSLAAFIVPGSASAGDVADSVVKIVAIQKTNGIASGSGVVISEDGVVLTNAHVVHDAKALFIIVGTGKPVQTKLLWETPALDLAAISAKGLSLPALPMTAVAVVREQTVRAFGYPGVANTIEFDDTSDDETVLRAMSNKEPVTVTRGIVSNVTRRSWGLIDNAEAQVILHTAAIHHGNSGGPLLDECDTVVGINTALAGSSKVQVLSETQAITDQSVTLYKSLDASEVIEDLRIHHVRFISAGGVCRPAGASVLGPAGSGLPAALAVGGCGILVVGGAIVVLVLRRPRERVIHVQESYSRWLRRQPGPPPGGSAAALSGVTIQVRRSSGGAPLGIAVSSDRLAGTGIVLGRAPDCDLVIPSDTVSRHHLRLTLAGGRLRAEDLRSRNGVVVEGMGRLSPGRPVELALPAVLRLGNVSVDLLGQ